MMNGEYNRIFGKIKNNNIAYFCTRYQCEMGFSEKTAVRWVYPDLSSIDVTFGQLEELSNRCANLLTSLKISYGDPVFAFLPKSPELFVFFMATLKVKAIAGVLFSNFGEEALLDRLGDSKAKILLTNRTLLRKIKAIWQFLPDLEKIIVVDIDDHENKDILSYRQLINNASADFEIPYTTPNEPSVIHYTSGSTGKPKGVLHVHRSVISQVETFRNVLNVKDHDIFWCTADPGWVTGVSYGIIAPLSQGITQIQYTGTINPETWFEILQSENVNIWYTAPTALRMLMQENPKIYAKYDLSALRHIFSVGEPLNPNVIEWVRSALRKDVYDTWFQTETGSIMIANRPGMRIQPGSMGKPFNVKAMILDENNQILPAGQQGRLCLEPGWHSMFINYINKQDVYKEKFSSGYYDTGDIACQDDTGYFWFFGRRDDVINTSGHLVGPFEIESALLEFDEVVEVGVIGAPDEMKYEKVVAYIRLKKGEVWSKHLELKLRLHISNKLSSIATPQEFVIVSKIPKNKSGKILRRLLKAIYIGEKAGDISTLEDD
jgi:acetyl-CoA synthetase